MGATMTLEQAQALTPIQAVCVPGVGVRANDFSGPGSEDIYLICRVDGHELASIRTVLLAESGNTRHFGVRGRDIPANIRLAGTDCDELFRIRVYKNQIIQEVT